MRALYAAIVIVTWAGLAAGRDPDPTPPPESWIGQGNVRAALQEMVLTGLARVNETEVAGFAIRHADGTVTVERWPDRFKRNRQTFRGRIPAGAVAVVHTHPEGWSPLPSEDDARVARTTGLPVIALSRLAIWVVEPGPGRPRALVTRRHWVADTAVLARFDPGE